jgi:serine/threonine protein kinase
MAPEVYDDVCDYTWAVDVYSFAVIVYEVLVGQRAFPPTLTPAALMKKVIIGERLPLPVDMDATVETIIERGWSVDVTIRPSFDEIISVLGSIQFKLSSGVDSGRGHEFMSLVRSVLGPSESECLSERRSTNVSDEIVDVASEDLSKSLLADWDLPVSRREFSCVFRKRKKVQKVKKGLQPKPIDVEVDEAIRPLVGIFGHLTRKCRDNVPEHGIVRVTESSVRRNALDFAAKNAADLGSDSVFHSGWEPEQWLCYRGVDK